MEDKGIESLSDIEEVQGQTGSASEEKPSEKDDESSASGREEREADAVDDFFASLFKKHKIS